MIFQGRDGLVTLDINSEKQKQTKIINATTELNELTTTAQPVLVKINKLVDPKETPILWSDLSDAEKEQGVTVGNHEFRDAVDAENP